MLKRIPSLIKVAWKDTRGSRKRLLLYASGLFLGITVLVFSLTVREQVIRILDLQALAMIGADISLRGKDPIPKDLIENITVEASLREVRFRSMVLFKEGLTRLTQIRASEKGFPFYGEIHTNPPGIWKELKDYSDKIILDESLFLSSNAAIGETVKIGNKDFIILGSISKVPGVSPFNSAISPRIFMSYEAAKETGLLSRQSIADYFLHLKLDSNKTNSALKKLTEILPSEFTIETAQKSRERLGSINDNIIIYLSLVGLACLALGAIGATTSIYFYLQGKLKDAAILKSLGFKGGDVTCIYLLQLLAASFISAFLGCVFGTLIFYMLTAKLSSFFTIAIEFTFPFRPFLIGLMLGTFTLLLAAAPGILILKKTPVLVLLREELSLRLSLMEKLLIIIFSFLVFPVFLLLLTSPLQALLYGTGLNIIIVFLWLISAISKKAALKVGRYRLPFILRYALLGLGRPGNASNPIINAFSLSVVLSATLLIIQHILAQQVVVIKADRTANLFIYDVAQDQTSNVRELLKTQLVDIAEEVPIVLMRIKKLNSQTSAAILRQEKSNIPTWTLNRDYWTSYRSDLLANEDLLSGTWIGEYDVQRDGEIIPVSLDAKLAENLQLQLGDLIEFDVQGVTFKTKVSSLRRIRWEQMQRNAFVVFPKGVLEDAPKFLFLTAHVPDSALSARLQRLLVEKFPGISVVDIRFIADTLVPMLQTILQAVTVLSGLVVLTACMILITALLSSKESRNKELELLRILGATRSQTGAIGLLEYSILAAISSTVGILLSVLIAYLLATFVFQQEFSLPWTNLGILFIGSLLLISSISLASESRGKSYCKNSCNVS